VLPARASTTSCSCAVLTAVPLRRGKCGTCRQWSWRRHHTCAGLLPNADAPRNVPVPPIFGRSCECELFHERLRSNRRVGFQADHGRDVRGVHEPWLPLVSSAGDWPSGGLAAAFSHGTGWWAGHSALSDHSRCFKAVNKRGSLKPAAQGSITWIFEFSGVCWITPCLRRLAPKATAMSPRFRGLASLGPRHAWPGARCGRSSRRNPVHHAKTRSASGTLRNVTRSRGPR